MPGAELPTTINKKQIGKKETKMTKIKLLKQELTKTKVQLITFSIPSGKPIITYATSQYYTLISQTGHKSLLKSSLDWAAVMQSDSSWRYSSYPSGLS